MKAIFAIAFIALTSSAFAQIACKAYCVQTASRVNNGICRNMIKSYVELHAEGNFRSDALRKMKKSCNGHMFNSLSLPPNVVQVGNGRCLPLGGVAEPDNLECDVL